MPVMARPKSARRKRGQTEATDRNMAESLVRKLQRHMHTEQWRQVDLFWRMDDGTGEVTAPQMHAALRQLQMAPSRSEVGALVRRFDTDGNGRVSIAEFLRHLRHAKRDYGDADGAVSTDSGASSSGGGGGGVKARCEELEGQVQSLTDENFMLQLQLSKLQRTLRNTQSSLAAAQANGSVPVPVPEPEDNATSTQAFSLREGWGRVSDAGGDHRRAETAEKLGEQLREELAAERQRSQRADASAAELRRRLASVEAALARVGSSAQRHLAQQEEQREQRDQAVAELQSERQSWQAERAGLQAELAGRGAVEQTLSAEVQQLRRQKDDVQMKLVSKLTPGPCAIAAVN